jgi:hypothetical protein
MIDLRQATTITPRELTAKGIRMDGLTRWCILMAMATLAPSCAHEEQPPPASPAVPTATYDTLFPLDYFPAFPGSWWRYLDATGDTVLVSTDPVYRKDAYTIGEAAFMSDTVLVPVHNNIPIWGYLAHTGPISHSGSYPFTRMVSDSLPVNASWVVASWAGTQVSRRIVARDTTVEVLQVAHHPTIVVEEYFSMGPPTYTWTTRRYFAKDVGLVREDTCNASGAVGSRFRLVDHFITP